MYRLAAAFLLAPLGPLSIAALFSLGRIFSERPFWMTLLVLPYAGMLAVGAPANWYFSRRNRHEFKPYALCGCVGGAGLGLLAYLAIVIYFAIPVAQTIQFFFMTVPFLLFFGVVVSALFWAIAYFEPR